MDGVFDLFQELADVADALVDPLRADAKHDGSDSLREGEALWKTMARSGSARVRTGRRPLLIRSAVGGGRRLSRLISCCWLRSIIRAAMRHPNPGPVGGR
jgi:hypothetical protein